jgi:hypothetical protein
MKALLRFFWVQEKRLLKTILMGINAGTQTDRSPLWISHHDGDGTTAPSRPWKSLLRIHSPLVIDQPWTLTQQSPGINIREQFIVLQMACSCRLCYKMLMPCKVAVCTDTQYTRRQWNTPIQPSNFQSWDLSVGPLKGEIRGCTVTDCPQ